MGMLTLPQDCEFYSYRVLQQAKTENYKNVKIYNKLELINYI